MIDKEPHWLYYPFQLWIEMVSMILGFLKEQGVMFFIDLRTPIFKFSLIQILNHISYSYLMTESVHFSKTGPVESKASRALATVYSPK